MDLASGGFPFYILCTYCPFIDFLFREPQSELSYFTPIDDPEIW